MSDQKKSDPSGSTLRADATDFVPDKPRSTSSPVEVTNQPKVDLPFYPHHRFRRRVKRALGSRRNKTNLYIDAVNWPLPGAPPDGRGELRRQNIVPGCSPNVDDGSCDVVDKTPIRFGKINATPTPRSMSSQTSLAILPGTIDHLADHLGELGHASSTSGSVPGDTYKPLIPSGPKESDLRSRSSTTNSLLHSNQSSKFQTPRSVPPNYNGTPNTDPSPVYGQALTWKSEAVKAKDELARIKHRVKAVAPEMFKDKAAPSSEKATIMPTTAQEWIEFKAEMAKQLAEEIEKNKELMVNQIKAAVNMDKDGIPRKARVPRSVFGTGAGQKSFDNAYGNVLGQPSIWSDAHLESDVPKAAWPSTAELLWNGDGRENSTAGTRVGRALPQPRLPPEAPNMSFQEQEPITPYPMDQTGPVYRDADSKLARPYPSEVEDANNDMNNDPIFEAEARHLLGSDLMDEIGRYKPAVVPEWQEKARRQQSNLQESVQPDPMYQAEFRDISLLGKPDAESSNTTLVNAYAAAAAAGVPVPAGHQYIGRRFLLGGKIPEDVYVTPEMQMVRYRHGYGWYA